MMDTQVDETADTGTTDDGVLHFPDGLPGLPGARRFLLRDIVEDGAFQLLSCLDVPDLELVVGHPWLFFPDYAPEIGDDDQRELGLGSPQDVLLFCAVTLPEGDDAVPTMNLLGPFVVNRHTLVGRQVVLTDEESTPVRAPLELA